MKTLTAILVFGLLSCGQPVTTAESKTGDDTTSQGRIASDRKPGLSGDSHMLGSDIYERYIDPQLKTYLDKAFIGWHLPPPRRWDTLWFRQYKSDSNLVNYISGDFDCNEKKDYAILFKKASGVIAAFAFLSTGHTFKAVELMDLGKDSGEHIEVGLELLPPGDYNYIEADSEEDPLPIRIKCNSVQVLHFERAAKTFYWEKGKMNSITTGD